MTVPVFPSIPGLTYPIKRTQRWSAVKPDALNGKRTRLSLFTYPVYDYELTFSFLRSAAAYAELQTLMGFINELNGPTDLFAFTDQDDNAVTAQTFGIGNGTTQNFQLLRTWGSFTEPIFLLNGTPSIYINGVLQSGSAYVLNAYGNVAFITAPSSAAVLTWTGSFYWPCRFDSDATDFSNFMHLLYELKSLKFSTEKLSIVLATP